MRKYLNIARYALYDAGNSNYITLGPSLGFQVYIVILLASSGIPPDLVWGGLIAGATLVAAVLSPKMGAWVDRSGSKFGLLRWMSLAAIVGTAMLAVVGRFHIAYVAVVFLATHTCYLLATVLYDAALSDVSTRENAATVSSVAWGVGYAGGVVGLVLALLVKGDDAERLGKIFLMAAGLFLVLAAPLCLARGKAAARKREDLDQERQSLIALIRSFMKDRTRARMLLSYFLYSNGVSAVVYFTAAYAKTTLGYKLDDLIRLFIAMNLVAAPSSIVLGKVAERVGQIRTLKVVVAAWAVVVVIIACSGDRAFPIVACCAASLIGPVQALSRSLFRIIFPEEQMSTFFGIQSIAARGSALIGPLLFGAASWLSGSQRVAALTAALLFGAGLAVLFSVPKGVEGEGRVVSDE